MRAYFRSYLAWANFTPFADSFGHYWALYGRWGAVLKSPLAHLSIVFSAVAWGTGRACDWTELAVSIIPSLMGFSLGAMAIVLAFPTTRMFEVLSEGGRQDSYYMDMASKFLHFFVLQTFALICGMCVPSGKYAAVDVLGFWLLTYSSLTGLALAISLYATARLYNHPGSHEQGDASAAVADPSDQAKLIKE